MTSPPPRRGPRPLPLHLRLAVARAWAALGSIPGAPIPDLPEPWKLNGSTPESPSSNPALPRSKAGRQEAARITAALAAGGHRPEAFQAAVLRVLRRQDAALIKGLAGYRRHPQRRAMPEPPVVWAEGGSRLLDYAEGSATPGPAVLVVPSLVNRADVLDLLPEASCLRHLAGQGARPLLLDWGAPGAAERGFSLTDYVAGRLERALQAAFALTGGKLVLAGYCMGGLLALAAAQRRPELVAALALWATPWDFWAEGESAPRALAAQLPMLEPLLEAIGTLPIDAIQMLFANLEPFAIAEKYRGFARLDPSGPRARRFIALEDWLNDGVALSAPVARECLAGWYGANTPMRGTWRIAGEVVAPARLSLPGFLAIPSRDRIVPPATALALAPLLPKALVHRAAAGHVGMVAGSTAEAALWAPFLAWRASLPI
jgi:polyhydroxyalkanoate synthase